MVAVAMSVAKELHLEHWRQAQSPLGNPYKAETDHFHTRGSGDALCDDPE
jgi:hypothetical protein